jgi:hypothetical protein
VLEFQELDLSNLKTKPFEPKLPLPEIFDSYLIKAGITQLHPIINQYLADKPIFLPERISPLIQNPDVLLTHIRKGLGYSQILSYCTCSDFQAHGAFPKCKDQSGLCKPQLDINHKERRIDWIDLENEISKGPLNFITATEDDGSSSWINGNVENIQWAAML